MTRAKHCHLLAKSTNKREDANPQRPRRTELHRINERKRKTLKSRNLHPDHRSQSLSPVLCLHRQSSTTTHQLTIGMIFRDVTWDLRRRRLRIRKVFDNVVSRSLYSEASLEQPFWKPFLYIVSVIIADSLRLGLLQRQTTRLVYFCDTAT